MPWTVCSTSRFPTARRSQVPARHCRSPPHWAVVWKRHASGIRKWQTSELAGNWQTGLFHPTEGANCGGFKTRPKVRTWSSPGGQGR